MWKEIIVIVSTVVNLVSELMGSGIVEFDNILF